MSLTLQTGCLLPIAHSPHRRMLLTRPGAVPPLPGSSGCRRERSRAGSAQASQDSSAGALVLRRQQEGEPSWETGQDTPNHPAPRRLHPHLLRDTHVQRCRRPPSCSLAHSHAPGLLVAEFLGDHLAQLQPEPVRHPLGQVAVGAAAEQHDVRHGGREGCGEKGCGEKERRDYGAGAQITGAAGPPPARCQEQGGAGPGPRPGVTGSAGAR